MEYVNAIHKERGEQSLHYGLARISKLWPEHCLAKLRDGHLLVFRRGEDSPFLKIEIPTS